MASLADELGMSRRGIGGWQSGERAPENAKAVLMALDALLKRKRVPKQRRYAKGSRTRNVGAGDGDHVRAAMLRQVKPE